jgi:hypothetical protein
MHKNLLKISYRQFIYLTPKCVSYTTKAKLEAHLERGIFEDTLVLFEFQYHINVATKSARALPSRRD